MQYEILGFGRLGIIRLKLPNQNLRYHDRKTNISQLTIYLRLSKKWQIVIFEIDIKCEGAFPE